jgi:uncharacterized membrane protein
MKLRIVEFVTLMLASLVMGVFWGTWFTLTRSLHDFSAAEFIHIGKTIIRNVAIPMSIIMPATLFFMLIAVLLSRRRNRSSFYLYIISFLLMVTTLIITVAVEVPIDNQIKTWTETTVPSNWESLRQRWNIFHTIRTFTSIASLVFFSWGVMRRVQQTRIEKEMTLHIHDRDLQSVNKHS